MKATKIYSQASGILYVVISVIGFLGYFNPIHNTLHVIFAIWGLFAGFVQGHRIYAVGTGSILLIVSVIGIFNPNFLWLDLDQPAVLISHFIQGILALWIGIKNY